MFKTTIGPTVLLVLGLLVGCAQDLPTSQVPLPPLDGSPLPPAPTPPPAPSAAMDISSSTPRLRLGHWKTETLALTLTANSALRGPVSLRLERLDGSDADLIEVSPRTVTLADLNPTPVSLRLRPTRMEYPAEYNMHIWRLVASQGAEEVGSMAMPLTMDFINFTFKLQPVTAREGQTVSATLTVDADTRDLPPFTFGLSPYIPDEISEYELVEDPERPTQYRVTSLPATFKVPVMLKSFRSGQTPPNRAAFQLSVDGLTSLGSQRYGRKYVRADLIWNLAR